MSKSSSVWWVMVVSNIIAFFWMWYFGLVDWVIETDVTYISLLIVVLYAGTLLWLPKQYSLYRSGEEIYETPNYIANHLPALGLLGTVVGLMLAVMVMAEMKIDSQNQKDIIDMMKQMFSALSTSLITTIVGIILSLVLKFELLVLETVYNNEK